MADNKMAVAGSQSWGNGYNTPKTTTTKTTKTKKKFDKDGKVVSETTTIVEESVTTYDWPNYTVTNGTSSNPGNRPTEYIIK